MTNEVALLTQKLTWAADELERMAKEKAAKGAGPQAERLTAKAEGVRLALSYVGEIRW